MQRAGAWRVHAGPGRLVRALVEPGRSGPALSGPSGSGRSGLWSLGSVRVKGPIAPVWVGGTKQFRIHKQNFRRSFGSALTLQR